jgi:hypothetical protein
MTSINNIVLQPQGIGDVIFCQQLIKEITTGPVIWPVLPHFIEGLKVAYPGINFVPKGIIASNYENMQQDTIIDGNRIIPIRFADRIQKVPYRYCMRSKYDMYNKDWKNWNLSTFERNLVNENKLVEVLKIDLDKPFCLVNTRFKSLFNRNVPINPQTDLPIVEMQNIEGFSLFDWSTIISAATEIHTVSTSIIYIFELLQLKAERIFIYLRAPEERNHLNYNYILRSHNYILM